MPGVPAHGGAPASSTGTAVRPACPEQPRRPGTLREPRHRFRDRSAPERARTAARPDIRLASPQLKRGGACPEIERSASASRASSVSRSRRQTRPSHTHLRGARAEAPLPTRVARSTLSPSVKFGTQGPPGQHCSTGGASWLSGGMRMLVKCTRGGSRVEAGPADRSLRAGPASRTGGAGHRGMMAAVPAPTPAPGAVPCRRCVPARALSAGLHVAEGRRERTARQALASSRRTRANSTTRRSGRGRAPAWAGETRGRRAPDAAPDRRPPPARWPARRRSPG